MRKQTIAAMLILFIMLMLCPVGFAKTYPDVSKGSSAFEAVDYLSDIRIVAGYDDGFFLPDKEITRSEAAALIGRAVGYKDDYKAGELPFEDVKPDYWAKKFISFCYEAGIINGMTKTSFCPADKVTYAQVVKMLVCASGLDDEILNAKGEKWYEEYLRVAEDNGILDNVAVYPNEAAPRGDVAILVYNCILGGLIDAAEEEEIEEEPDEENEADTNEDNEEAPSEEEKPKEPARAKKEDVLFSVKVPNDYEFAKGIDYTPELDEDDIDFSGIKKNSAMEELLIVVDPGHNFKGTDIGAYNEEYEVWEQNITWPIAKMLEQKLERMGFEVVMTRDSYNDCIKGSSTMEALLNRAGIANYLEADLFISIHCNAGGGTGVETYCFKRGTNGEALAEAVQEELISATKLIDRGVKTANFVVIKETLMPAILVETAFLDREEDFEFLISKDGQNKLSTAIAKGVLEYANQKDKER